MRGSILRRLWHRLLFSRTPTGTPDGAQADVAQLVERNLAKVEVASSSLVVRSERSLPGLASVVGWPRGEATDCKSVYTGSNPVPTSQQIKTRAIGAVVARFPDTEEVTGSNPVSPTSKIEPLTCGDVDQGLSSSRARVQYVSNGWGEVQDQEPSMPANHDSLSAVEFTL